MPPTLKSWFGLAAVVAIAGVTGCAEDEGDFAYCPLSQTVIDVCEEDSAGTSLTCVVADHPMCDELICAQWDDSEPFCSRACVEDDDCPVASSCQNHLTFSFCVPDEVLSSPTVAE